jgi:hypothetical protein
MNSQHIKYYKFEGLVYRSIKEAKEAAARRSLSVASGKDYKIGSIRITEINLILKNKNNVK